MLIHIGWWGIPLLLTAIEWVFFDIKMSHLQASGDAYGEIGAAYAILMIMTAFVIWFAYFIILAI